MTEPLQTILTITPRKLFERLARDVQDGRSVVPLVGAGVSIESGVPPLAGLTRYLGLMKAFLRWEVYKLRGEYKPYVRDGEWPALSQPWEYLRSFGWPDPHELDTQIGHWLHSSSPNEKTAEKVEVVEREIYDTLRTMDSGLADIVQEHAQKPAQDPGRRQLQGSYWKLLLPQLTRSSPDLIDALFQKLTRRRQPSTSHRFLALLAPVLRLRLILTINFDPLIEDALRIEGVRPKVFEVADGLSLPYPQLSREGLSVIKLHGGSFGLRVGDRLDMPLDEETSRRFRAHLPKQPRLLVMGVGGWDQRVLDMVQLTLDVGGQVNWLHFKSQPPAPLAERFAGYGKRIATTRVQDPGGFLRELYYRLTVGHPSSRRPLRSFHLPPLTKEEATVITLPPTGERTVAYIDLRPNHHLGASRRLAGLVAALAASHRPLWVDLETRYAVGDVAVEMLRQLRRYDPGLSPELLAVEQVGLKDRHSPEGQTRFRTLIRRLFNALARGRYVIALNGVDSFGRHPLRHHASAPRSKEVERQRAIFLLFVEQLLQAAKTGRGFAGSVLALSFENGIEADDAGKPDDSETYREPLLRLLQLHCEHQDQGQDSMAQSEEVQPPSDPWYERPDLVLLTAFRRRRDLIALQRLLPKYLNLGCQTDMRQVDKVIDKVVEDGHAERLEGGELWMSRSLRDAIYALVTSDAAPGRPEEDRVRALAFLVFLHRDLAMFYLRERYVGSHDVEVLIESLYHRVASLRYFTQLQDLSETVTGLAPELEEWIDRLEPLVAVDPHLAEDKAGLQSIAPSPWAGNSPIHDQQGLKIDAIAERRFRGVKALRKLLEQEREALVTRLPGELLRHWLEALNNNDELTAITAPGAAPAPWGEGLEREQVKMRRFLEDFQVQIYAHRMDFATVQELRLEQLNKLLPSDCPAGPHTKELSPRAINELFSVDRADSHQQMRIVDILLDLSWAAHRTGRFQQTEDDPWSKQLEQLLEDWRKEPEHDYNCCPRTCSAPLPGTSKSVPKAGSGNTARGVPNRPTYPAFSKTSTRPLKGRSPTVARRW